MFKKSLVLSVMLSSSVFAANNLFEVTPQIGGDWHVDNDRYDNEIDLTYGIKFATRVAPTWLVEAGYERVDNADYTKKKFEKKQQSTDINRYYMNLVKEFETSTSVSPYLLGGVGYEDLSNNSYSMDDDMFAQYGVGLRWEAMKHLHFKTELRHLISFDGRSDVIAMLGFAIPFGTYAEPQKVVVQEEVIEEPVVEAEPVLTHIHEFKAQFPFDSSVVDPKYNHDIADFAAYLKQNPNHTAIIKGYTDSKGSEAYNQKLSERRANAIKESIINEGIDASRLDAKGYGELEPVADNDTEEGRQRNRRVSAEVYQR